MKNIIVAIDGHSSCGKSTIAKELSKYAKYRYIDTGAMYRAVSLYAIENGLMDSKTIDELRLKESLKDIKISFVIDKNGNQQTVLNDENVEHKIRTLTVANGASRVSAIGFVREELVRQQQQMGKSGGIVMDGRDIGTVVFPNAELKLFITADSKVRAERRYKELIAKGENISYESVLSNVQERDRRDTTRAESPLYRAEDAILIDNSNLNREEQLALVVEIFNKVVQMV